MNDDRNPEQAALAAATKGFLAILFRHRALSRWALRNGYATSEGHVDRRKLSV